MNQANITAEGCPVTEAELEAIARYSRRRLTAEEVYTFPLVLCDNDLARDHECFTDAALEKRLSSLVTAGDETVSASDTAARLRDWRNRCRHNRTGLLPQTLMELQETENTLEQIRRLHRSDMELTARREAYLAQQEKLQTLIAALKAREG